MTRHTPTHAFADSGQTNWAREPICATCDNLRSHSSHRLSELTDDQRALALRMTGEPASVDPAPP